MKKLLPLIMIISTNSIYSQYLWDKQDANGYVLFSKNISCTYCQCSHCNGKGEVLEDYWVPCYKCKDWADSYRNARGCDVCKNKKGKYENRYTKCMSCAGKGKLHNIYLDDLAKENSYQDYVKKNNEERENKADQEYENIRVINTDEDIKKRKIYLQEIYERGEGSSIKNGDNQPVLTKSFPSKEQIKKDLIGRKIGTWTFDKLEEFKSVRILEAEYWNVDCFSILITFDLIDYRTKDKYHGSLNITYVFKYNEWEVGFLNNDAEIIKEK